MLLVSMSHRSRTVLIALGGALITVVLFVLLGTFGGEARAAEAPTCTAGDYLKDGVCVPADPGHFVADGGAVTQTRCAVGRYQDEPGQTSCKVIPLGSGGAGGQPDGTGSTSVALCEAGTFRGAADTTGCTAASVGYFVATAGAQSATICPVGQYQDTTGQTACKQVPAGSEATGGKTDGTRSTGVRLCPAGTFTASAGAGTCTPAPAGSFVAAQGAIAAVQCSAGTYSPSTGATACTPAAVGNYVPGRGATEQLRCPTATTTGLATCPAPTVTPAPAPTPAAPVTGGPTTGNEPLSPQGDECPPGTWSATGTSRAGSSCTPASPGTFVALAGATEAEPCPPGSFSDGFGATECTPAPIGTFVSAAGAMDPTPCPGATEPGLTSCPVVLAVPVAAETSEPSSGSSVWLWVVGLLLALGAGGTGFVILQRRSAAPLDLDAGPAPSAPSTASPASPPASGVLEWDEALDGAPEDGDGPLA